MTAGVLVPLDLDLFETFLDELPVQFQGKKPAEVLDDRRVAAALYRVALADGLMDRVQFRDVG